MERNQAITDLRTTLEWLGDDVKWLAPEVDPVIEATAISKAFDDGPAFVAEHIKGYPGARYIGNLWTRRERVAKLVGVDDYRDVKHRIIHAVKHPIQPKVVSDAPAQQVVIPHERLDPFALFPMVQHTRLDGGRFFGSGVHYISGKWAGGETEHASQLSFYRMSFRGNDYASINMIPGGHGDQIAGRFHKERIPCTVNLSPPPMVEMMGMGHLNAAVWPTGEDEIGAAGALQGSPVEIVRAKTVDAWAIAQAEWVIEGYIVPSERVWETEEAERLGRQGEAMLHPEWARYMGRAYRSRKFEVTAITHRADRPYYYVPRVGTPWVQSPFTCATYYELAQRIAPGLVVDVATYHAMLTSSGVVFQVKKRRRTDEGLQRNVLAAAMGVARGLRMAIAVDEDIDIHQPEDVLWAITSRVNPLTDIVHGMPGGAGQAFQPTDRMAGGRAQASMAAGGIAIDATLPFGAKEHYVRARYPVEEVDFTKWFSEAEIRTIRSSQDGYTRFLAESGLL